MHFYKALAASGDFPKPYQKAISSVFERARIFYADQATVREVLNSDQLDAITKQVNFAQANPNSDLPDLLKNISLPFPVCYFENLLYPRLVPPALRDTNYGPQLQVPVGEFFIETGPGAFSRWVLALGVKDGIYSIRLFNDASATDRGLACVFLQTLKSCRKALETSEVEFLKPRIVGVGYHKLKEIRQIIHLAPKKHSGRVKPLFAKEVQWTHRWEVMGHWRKCGGVGKNREGQYCVEGFTWVMPHERGDESLPLVKKTRVMSQGQLMSPVEKINTS